MLEMILTAEPKDLKPNIGRVRPLDGPMILLDDVVQILGLPKLNGRAAVSDQAAHGRRIGAALVDRDACRHVVQVDRALKETPHRSHVAMGRQQEVHRLAKLVDGMARYRYFHWPPTRT